MALEANVSDKIFEAARTILCDPQYNVVAIVDEKCNGNLTNACIKECIADAVMRLEEYEGALSDDRIYFEIDYTYPVYNCEDQCEYFSIAVDIKHRKVSGKGEDTVVGSVVMHYRSGTDDHGRYFLERYDSHANVTIDHEPDDSADRIYHRYGK